jgi:hypothetical protein
MLGPFNSFVGGETVNETKLCSNKVRPGHISGVTVVASEITAYGAQIHQSLDKSSYEW